MERLYGSYVSVANPGVCVQAHTQGGFEGVRGGLDEPPFLAGYIYYLLDDRLSTARNLRWIAYNIISTW